MNINKTVSRYVQQIKKSARESVPAIIGYDHLLEFCPISSWVDNCFANEDRTDVPEDEFWAVVEAVEERLEKWEIS
jgi:hypothetical protein